MVSPPSAPPKKGKAPSALWRPLLPASSALLALGLFAWIYRGRLAWALYADPEMQVPHPVGVALGGAWQDAAVAVIGAALVGCATLLLRKLTRWPWLRWTVGLAGLLPALIAMGANCQTHLRSVRALHSGLTFGLLQETWDSGEIFGVLTQTGWVDLAAISAPLTLFLAVIATLRTRPRWAAVLGPAVVAALAAAALALGHPGPGDQPAELTDSPVAFTAVDIARHLHEMWDQPQEKSSRLPRLSGPTAAGAALPGAATEVDDGEDDAGGGAAAADGLRLADAPWSKPANIKKKLPVPGDKPWNVVWVIMESTGRRYLQGDTPKGVQPMPFLVDDLAKRGWWLSRHRSPSNSSATSIFAQLSGLYPSPSTKMFSVSKDNWIPTLFNFLGDRYERFLVTPGKLSFFFPYAFLTHGGIAELHGYDELKHIKSVQSENFVRNEIDVMSFFLQRLRKAKPPFAAVYYSFTPHWEYVDYGPQWHRFAGQRPQDRYLNGLYLLDTQLQRLVAQLQDDGLLDRTILVFAGDHGEAFGQHDRNWAHSRASFEENFATPGLLVQPKLFPPKVFEQDTLHIDLLPTVLDAMGIAYDDTLLQGESLYQPEQRRKYQFFWGNENTVSVIIEGAVKLQWAVGENRCTAYDLRTDPREKNRLPCDRWKSDLELLKTYRERQRTALIQYSAAVRADQPFGAHRHPALWRTPKQGADGAGGAK